MSARVVAVLASMAVVAGVLTAVPVSAAGAPFTRLPAQHEVVVSGGPLAATPYAPDPSADRAVRKPAPAPGWPAAGTGVVNVSSTPGRAGALPVFVGRSTGASTQAGGPTRVTVTVLDRDPTARAGRSEVLLRVARDDGGTAAAPVSMSVDYRGFASAYGADWASRLHLVALPECALTMPDAAACQPTPMPSRTSGTGTVSAEVTAASGAEGTLYAVTAGPSGAAGSFAATSLAPSAAWSQGGSSGTFSWSYPMRTPPALGGPQPDLELSYSSQSVDGRTAASNNQPSWVGEGFGFTPGGYLERRYKPCAQDMGAGANNGIKTGDLCWATDNAVLSLGGSGTELIKDGNGGWHPRTEDGSRIERLTGAGNGALGGEYWKLTTVDGTQYFFGRRPETRSTWTVPVYGNHPNEPCNNPASFDASWCQQAWRWNLDHVVDRNGNSASYWYAQEGNKYGRNLDPAKATSYVRGGYLERVDYGTRADAESTPAPAQVRIDVADRCLPGTTCDFAHPQSWPDTPVDQSCGTATCPQLTPTFWTDKRLAKVTTKVQAQEVESWTFSHDYLDPGDSTRPGLWLSKISHVGLVGTATPPQETTFTGVQLNNRVDTGTDQLPEMRWYRVAYIRTETGGEIGVGYSAPDCVAGSRMPSAPESNVLRCFPVRWTPQGHTAPIQDYFHKYVVGTVIETDRTGGSPRVLTSYAYLGDPAWHYTDDDGLVTTDARTWSVWRGYGRVETRIGDPGEQTRTETRYFRGMDGDRLPSGVRSVSVLDSQGGTWPDTDALAGMPREEITFNGADEVGGEISDPWLSTPTATRTVAGSTVHARYARTATTRTRVVLDGNRGYRRTKVTNTFDSFGMVTGTEDFGERTAADGEVTDTDDRCTTTSYARNTGAWLMSSVSTVESFALSCDRTPAGEADVIGGTRTGYDDQVPGVAPTKGDVTSTDTITGWSGGAPTYLTTARARYDGNGRPTDGWDVKGGHSTTAYTGAPLTSTTVTNPLGHVTVTALDPAWGAPTKITDPNSRVTELGYDGLGRLTGSWLPGRAKGSQTANTTYAYLVRTTGANAVTTSTLTPSGGYATAYALYDAMARPRQTQVADARVNGGRIIADTLYDSAGRAVKVNSGYANAAPPGPDVFAPTGDEAIPRQTVTRYDGAGRPVASILRSRNVEQWRSATSYGGDRISVTPPAGGIPTTTIIDIRGRTAQLVQPSGGSVTTYTYDRQGRLAMIADPVGNIWTYGYDLRGRQIRTVDPDGGTAISTYNDAGELTSTTDARGKNRAFSYDALGRKTMEYKDSTSGEKLARWVYDTEGTLTALGRLISSTRFAGTDEYTVKTTGFDPNYRPTGTLITIPGVEGNLGRGYQFGATYKVNGAPSTVTVPAAGGFTQKEVLGFEYDSLGRPATFTGDTSYVTESQYTGFGEPNVYTFGVNGPQLGPIAQVGYYYQEATRRMNNLKGVRETAPSTLADVTYSFDAAGNVTKAADAPLGGVADTQCFGHDNLRRLTAAWTPAGGDCAVAATASGLGGPAPYWQTFSYDTVGNRKGSVDHATPAGDVTRTYAYPAAGAARPHAATSVTTTDTTGTRTSSYGYDQAGNTASRPAGGGTQTLTWDHDGHLAAVADAAGSTSYTYDADGNRLLARDPGGRTLYLPGMELRQNTAGTVTATRYYQHGGVTVASRTPTGGVSWLLPDRQGTSLLAVKAAGAQQVGQRRQKSFGEPRGVVPSWPNPRGYVGGSVDPTGLTHLGAREYDPAIGRFVSVDPILDLSDPQQMGGYAYADNSPVTMSDPDGLLPAAMGPDGECAKGCPYKPGKGPASTFNFPKPKPAPKVPAGTRCPDGARSCNAVAGYRPPARVLGPADCAITDFDCNREYDRQLERQASERVQAAGPRDRCEGLGRCMARLGTLATQYSPSGMTLQVISALTGWTWGYCLAAGGGAAPAVGGSLCYVQTPDGSSAYTVSAGGGGGFSPPSAGVGVTASSARSLSDVAGWSATVNGSIPAGPVGLGGSFGYDEADDGYRVYQYTLLVTPPGPPGGDIGASYTWLLWN